MNIQIVPNESTLVAGRKCTGKIVMQVKKQVSAKAIRMRLEGQESTQTVHSRTDSYNENQRDEETSRESHGLVKHFFDVEDQSCIVGGKIEPGNYDIGFSTILPSSLPSSLDIRSFDGYAKIDYTLHVNIEGSGWISNYKTKKAVMLQSCPEDVNLRTPFRKAPIEAKVRAFCCLGRGSIHWGVKLDDTHLCHGQDVKVSLSFVNDSTSSIDKVTGTLTQYVKWTARMNDERQKTELHQLDFGRMKEMTPKTKEDLRMLELSMSHTTEIQAQILLALEENANQQTIPSLSPKAYDTYAGRLIQIEHKLHLVLQTGTCVTDPKVEIPLKIVAGESGGAAAPPAAPGATTTSPSAPVSTTDNAASNDTEEAGAAAAEDEPELVVEQVADTTPSVQTLLAMMKITTNDLALVREKKNDSSWKQALASLKPEDLRNILAQVDMELDQTNVMVELASTIQNFTCAHLQAAIGRASEWNRTNMIEGLLPFCQDLDANSAKAIQDTLSDWESMVTKRAFESSLKK